MMRAVMALLAVGIAVLAVLILHPAHAEAPQNHLNVVVVSQTP
jgi:hypothetical protein